jgi:predicted esterase
MHLQELAKEQKETPIFQAHGDEDAIVPMQWGVQSKKHLESEIKNWTFNTYPRMGHSSSDRVSSEHFVSFSNCGKLVIEPLSHLSQSTKAKER